MFIKSFPLLRSTNVSLTTLLIQGLYQMLLSGCLWLSWDINWARRTLWCHTIPAHNYEQYRKGAKTGPSFWDSNCYVFSQGWRWGTRPHSRDWLKNHRTETRVPAAHGRLWPHVIHLTEVQGRTATTQARNGEGVSPPSRGLDEGNDLTWLTLIYRQRSDRIKFEYSWIHSQGNMNWDWKAENICCPLLKS